MFKKLILWFQSELPPERDVLQEIGNLFKNMPESEKLKKSTYIMHVTQIELNYKQIALIEIQRKYTRAIVIASITMALFAVLSFFWQSCSNNANKSHQRDKRMFHGEIR